MATKELPMERLAKLIADAFKPMQETVAANTHALQEHTRALLRYEGASPVEAFDTSDTDPAEVDPDELDPPKPHKSTAISFDMESAIRLSGQWECEGATTVDVESGEKRQLKCSDCPVDVNFDCLNTYHLLDDAERAVGKASTDDGIAFGLHRGRRGNEQVELSDTDAAHQAIAKMKVDVPVDRLRIVRRAVPPPPQAEKPAPSAPAVARAKAAKTPTKPTKPVPVAKPLKASIGDRAKAKAAAKKPKGKTAKAAKKRR